MLVYGPMHKALGVAAGGAAVVYAFLLFSESLAILGVNCSTGLLLSVFCYIFFFQYKAFQKHRLQEKKLVQEKIVLEVSRGLFDNVLEADITGNKVMGGNAAKLTSLLGIPGNKNYDEIICAIASQLVRADFQDVYNKVFSRENIINLCDENKSCFEYEFIERSDGIHYNWVRVYVRIYRAFDTGAVKIISHVKNIQQEKEWELAILTKAQRDPLTQLYNKAVTRELIEEFLVSEAGKGMHALCIIDIDNFKSINDNLGHAFGDRVLSAMAEKLSESVKASDIVGRIGGDEFLIFMKNIAGKPAVGQKAAELCQIFHDWLKSVGGNVETSLSIGICILPEDGCSFAEVYEKADRALYASKNKGKNTFTFFDSSLTL